MDTRLYTYRTRWSEDDGQFVGLCAEFPSLSHLADELDEAYAGIRELVADVVADMEQQGESVPEPLSKRIYSGRFVARIPPERHRELAIDAAEAGISLNRLVSMKLSQ